MYSILPRLRESLDRRELVLEAKFFSLTEEESDQLALSFFCLIEELFGEACVLDWTTHKKKHFSSFAELQAMGILKNRNGFFEIGFTGAVKDPVIRNKTGLHRFQREWMYPSTPDGRFSGTMESEDFPAYYAEAVAPYLNEPGSAKKALLTLFGEEGRFDHGRMRNPFLEGSCVCAPTLGNNAAFEGCLYCWVPVACLEDELDRVAEAFCQWNLKTAKQFRHVNSYVQLTPRFQAHDAYFGKYPEIEVPGVPLFSVYAARFYLKETAWAHCVSPDTLRLGLDKEKMGTELETSCLDGGGCFLRVKKPIRRTTLSDLRTMKSVLSPMMMPGRRSIQTKVGGWRPRSCWEYIPLFPDEVRWSEEEGFLFEHAGQIHTELVVEAMQLQG